MVETKLTGYPHLDRPWMKYYNLDSFEKTNTSQSIYDYMVEKSKAHPAKIAMTFYRDKISYEKLYEKIDEAARILTSIGVKSKERILVLMPNVPETAYTMYGASKIGAVTDYVDPRPDSIDFEVSARKILTIAQEEGSKYIVALDLCYLSMIKPIENELKAMGINDVIVVSTGDSMSFKSKVSYIRGLLFNKKGEIRQNRKLLQIIKKKIELIKEEARKNREIAKHLKEAIASSPLNAVLYYDLVKENLDIEVPEIEFEPNTPSVIVHTSGTSGNRPKPIPLTNENLNEYVEQTEAAKMPIAPGGTALHMLPYFAAFGLVGVVHAGFTHSNNLIEIPAFDPGEFGKLIIKYRPQIIIGPPTWFLGLIDDPNMRHQDLSFIKMITYGGDSMEPEDEVRVNEFLIRHNCKVKLTKGHGMSETCGCSSYADGEYNLLGTMGIPMPFSTYGIVDPETKEPVNFEDKEEIEGELIISTPLMTPGELDGKKYIQTMDLDGKTYILTKDIAKMNRDGVMRFLQRSDRGFMRFDGFKVKPFEIEKVIKQDARVKYCVISPYFDETTRGNKVLASIVLEDGIELSIEEQRAFVEDLVLKNFVENADLSARHIPAKFTFRQSLPLTANSKVDYKAIKDEGLTGEEIDVIILENNISITNILFKAPDIKRLKKSQ